MTAAHRPHGRTRSIAGAAALATTLALTAATATAATAAGSAPARTAAGPSVVASTSWVAAIAKLAGAGKITIIAPASLQHPPDYEPKASDLLAVSKADFVLVAGYEGFVAKLREAAGGNAKIVMVANTYQPAALASAVTKLGAALGTRPVAAANAVKVKAALSAVCTGLRKQLGSAKPVVVSHVVVADWAVCAGLAPVGVFGPAPITPSEVKKLAAAKPGVVFESFNMEGSAQAIAGSTGAKVISLGNFPDAGLDLIAVAKKNAAAIVKVVAG